MNKKERAFARGNATMVGLGAILITYLALVAHRFGHPIHWIWTAVGGIAGYTLALAWFFRPERWRRKKAKK